MYTVQFGIVRHTVQTDSLDAAKAVAEAMAHIGWGHLSVTGPDGETIPWKY